MPNARAIGLCSLVALDLVGLLGSAVKEGKSGGIAFLLKQLNK